MFKVPRYTATNYKQIILRPYNHQETKGWIDFNYILNSLDKNFIQNHSDLDSRRIGVNFPQEIVEMKLLIPTLYLSDQCLWNVGEGKSYGIDIVLPKGTPVPAFDSGVVVRVENSDLNKYLIIKGTTCFWCYKNCSEINVNLGDFVKRGEKIATVGFISDVGKPHIYLQCDCFESPIQPYFDNDGDIENIKKYTKNPINELKKILPNTGIFYDMPISEIYSKPIIFLHKSGLIDGMENYIYPFQFLKRHQFALLVYRLLKKRSEYIKDKSIDSNTNGDFLDLDKIKGETLEAINFLKKYKIMNGFENKFNPYKNIKGQEVLAVLGRIFWGIKDMDYGHWYSKYVDAFVKKDIIKKDWEYIGFPIIRQEMFRILYNLIGK